MPYYDVLTFATKEGSAHMNNAVRRVYRVEAPYPEAARSKAIDAAYREGGLEHVNPRTVTLVRDTHNNNCDGGHCREATGEVRVYPLGGGGNLILCHACWAHENRFRYERGRETREPNNWPQVDWNTAKVYGDNGASPS